MVAMVYESCASSPLGRDFGLRDQIQGSAVSIMANIAEGFGRGRNPELIHYLRIASGSCAEVQSHLYVAVDVKLIDEDAFKQLSAQTTKVGKKLTNFRKYLENAKTNQQTNKRKN
ncbi:MAG: four helix bundle protein [Wenzhouxiangella sp.]|nr:four helix bundle protein [Wenzhouxiangella sp.]